MTTGNKQVDLMGRMNMQGNIIPHTWFHAIKMPSGKTDLNGIIILSEIVYWYRPTIVKSEETGFVTKYKKRFKGDLLHRSYDSFAEQFGLSKRQVTEAIKRLEDAGYVQRVFRNIRVNGTPMSNVLFIDINAEAIISMTHPNEVSQINEIPLTNKSDTSHTLGEGGLTNKSDTSHAVGGDVYKDYYRDYTETTQIYNDDDVRANDASNSSSTKTESENNAFKFYEQNGFGHLTPYVGDQVSEWINDTNEELVIHAMKIAIENGVLKWNYVNKILINWSNQKLKTVEAVEAHEQKRQAQSQGRRSFGRPMKKEILPDWYQEEGQTPVVEEQKEEIDPELEERKRRLKERLARRSKAGQGEEE